MRWNLPRLRDRILRWHARKVAREAEPDIVVTREPLIASLLANDGHSVILELHGLFSDGSEAARALEAIIADRLVSRIVCISHALTEELILRHPRASKLEILVAYDGADAGPEPTPPPVDHSFRVGYFGNLYPGKAMEVLTEVAPGAQDVQFEVYGGQETDVADWRPRVSGLRNLSLHGYVPHREVRPRMEACHALIAPFSRRVTDIGGNDIGRWMSPLKLFEYMAAGRPIIASDLPAIREVVTHGEHALLCDPDDSAEWQAALRRLKRDPELRGRLATNARALLLKRYTWDVRAKQILQPRVISHRTSNVRRSRVE